MTEEKHRELSLEYIRKAKEALDSIGVPFCLFLGSVLGPYRDHDFCPGDIDDIDFGIDKKYYSRLQEITDAMDKVGLKFTSNYTLKDEFAPEVCYVKVHEVADKNDCSKDIYTKVDLFFYETVDDKVVWRFYLNHEPITKAVSGKYFGEFGKLEFAGVEFNIPSPVEDYLKENYGDWRTPIHRDNWKWWLDNKCQTI